MQFSYDLQEARPGNHRGAQRRFRHARERVSYDYDDAGIRISALHEVDADASGGVRDEGPHRLPSSITSTSLATSRWSRKLSTTP
jgi:hypothetical protein